MIKFISKTSLERKNSFIDGFEDLSNNEARNNRQKSSTKMSENFIPMIDVLIKYYTKLLIKTTTAYQR